MERKKIKIRNWRGWARWRAGVQRPKYCPVVATLGLGGLIPLQLQLFSSGSGSTPSPCLGIAPTAT